MFPLIQSEQQVNKCLGKEYEHCRLYSSLSGEWCCQYSPISGKANTLWTRVLGEKGMEKLWLLTGTSCFLSLGVSSTMFAVAGNKHNNNKKNLKPSRYSCATHTASLHTAWWHAVIGADCCTLKFYTENNTKNVPISKGSYHFFRKSEGNIWQRKQKIQTICPCRYSVSVPFHFS